MDELYRYIESIVSKKISEPENLDEIIKKGISDNLISSQDANKYAFENPLKHLCLKEEEIGNLA